ncbi:SAM-dependent DNA methyltransferase [Jiella endophytica]|uniref:SAM-dependent DNA methyltransferase n=1 Tax=Jiella endophytica TaxID=2558362 RepID=A0A4Y8RE80_9HYPH|nr:SAM-dependent DNA methyltransferase [Jiella endophytica]TFF20521.1 SAM-dependent DNA methyltransferase [Jiella endophytica]
MTQAAIPRSINGPRIEAANSLDYFPTPPWATRALFAEILGTKAFRDLIVEDPACGEGHMAYVLQEVFGTVWASDVYDHGYRLNGGFALRDFLEPAAFDDLKRPDWIITNPPFGTKLLAFVRRALARARTGVAIYMPTVKLDGINRHRFVYGPRPPHTIAQFVERAPCHKGRWEPDGDTFTAYCWMIWRLDRRVKDPVFRWIPPCRSRLTFQRDIDLFGTSSAPPLSSSRGSSLTGAP